MIRHQAVGMADPAVSRDDMGESLKKQRTVGVTEKNLLPRIPPTG
jgi:hypothetical protein